MFRYRQIADSVRCDSGQGGSGERLPRSYRWNIVIKFRGDTDLLCSVCQNKIALNRTNPGPVVIKNSHFHTRAQLNWVFWNIYDYIRSWEHAQLKTRLSTRIALNGCLSCWAKCNPNKAAITFESSYTPVYVLFETFYRLFCYDQSSSNYIH